MIQINKQLIPDLDYTRSVYLGQNPDIDGYRDKSGIYGIYGCTKAPSTGIGVLEVLVYSGDWVVQRFTDIGDKRCWTRTFVSGTTWTNWNLINRWNPATDNGNGTFTINTSWDKLKEISFRTLGTDNASFSYITIPKEQWHNDGTYPVQTICFNNGGGFAGYASYTVTTKNENNFIITVAGNYSGCLIYYKEKG